ncbi:MAG: NPCBM/NEW2 domain-containing protein [bacterium]|nr:NPCBM/NEW2 domain-containing protein [bacterium]
MSRSLTIACAAAAAGLIGAAALPAQDPAATPAGTLSTIDGRTLTGRLSVDGNGQATLHRADAEAVTLAIDEIASFVPADRARATSRTRHRVWLRSGQELAGKAIRGIPAGDGKPARLAVTLALDVTLELPISTVRAIRHGGQGRETAPSSFAGDLAAAPDNNDLLYVQRNGKQRRFPVTVTGMQAAKVEFDLRGKSRDFAFEDMLGIVFGNNTGFAADEQRPPRAVIDFDTGDHLEGRLLTLGEQLRLRLDEGCEVEVASERISRLAVESDRLRWLSALKPQVQQTAAFDRVWPWTVDRSVAGPGFQLGGKTFGRGIGMVPKTRLTYDLGGEYDVFEAMIGIDDRGGPQAHAIFRVFVDGKQVFESNARTRGLPPEHVRIELNRCQSLAIEADFGKNYDLGDYCVFADARVLRR